MQFNYRGAGEGLDEGFRIEASRALAAFRGGGGTGTSCMIRGVFL
jgi:hypothetical protein